MFEGLYRKLQHLLQSDALEYVLAGLFIVVWWAASQVVGVLRRGRTDIEARPRRRLPLQ